MYKVEVIDVNGDFYRALKEDCPTLKDAQKFCQAYIQPIEQLVWEQLDSGTWYAESIDIDFFIEERK